MSKILLVAATEFEVQATKNKINANQVLITGVGVYATIFHLMKKISTHQYDLIIHAGVGGSFQRNLPLGSVVQISDERFADIGYETPDETFHDFFGSDLISMNEPPFENGWLNNPFQFDDLDLPRVKGITVNTVSGCSRTISQRTNYDAQIESMEGAGLFYVCKHFNLKFLSLRAISNYVTPRNRDHWQMERAITNLNKTLDLFFE